MTELRAFKFVAALVIEIKKIESDDVTKYSTFHCNSKAETIMNESNIDDVIEPICSTIISNIQKSPEKDLGWIIDSVVDHTVNIFKVQLSW